MDNNQQFQSNQAPGSNLPIPAPQNSAQPIDNRQYSSNGLPPTQQIPPGASQLPPALPPTQYAPLPLVSTPNTAQDVDLIEKEWVDKAKAIIAKTRSDPYTQANEIQKFKAHYIKKRYNKDIRVSENDK